MGGKLVLDDHSTFHDELDVIEFADAGDRMSIESDDTSPFCSIDSVLG